MLHKMGSHYFGDDFTVSEIILIEWLSWPSIFLQWELFNHTGQVYIAAEYNRTRADVLSVEVDAPQDEPVSFCIKLFLVLSLAMEEKINVLVVQETHTAD